MLALVALGAEPATAQAGRPVVRIRAGFDIAGALEILAREFEANENAPVRLDVRARRSSVCARALAKGDADMIVIGDQLSARRQCGQPWQIRVQHGREPALSARLGQFCTAVAVHPSSTRRRVTFAELSAAFHGSPKDASGTLTVWGRDLNTYREAISSKSYQILRDMGITRFSAKEDKAAFAMKKSPNGVIAALSRDRQGIGYFQYYPGLACHLRLLRISRKDGNEAVAPTAISIMEDRYPLTQVVRAYFSPDADQATRDVVTYLQGPGAEEALRKWRIFTELQRQRHIAKQRLAQMKSGKGTHLSAVGVEDGHSPLQDLAIEYVRVKDVVQLSYATSHSDVSSIGVFLGGSRGNRDLLFLGDKPSARAMELHGEKWLALGVDEKGQPTGGGPKEYVIAGRAVAVIVNPANKLESLTLGQIQTIFQGDVDDWAIIGGTELTPPAGPGGRSDKIEINIYGLYARELATAIFEKECLPRRKWRRVKYKKDTAAAVAAVSTDPRAIAFVDLTAIPGIGAASLAGDFAAAGQNVKVLAIQIGIGERAKIIQPTPENIRNAMYPLSQRYFLYVHPKASETAKDFAKFIATCGGSAAGPYADTVKAVMETYQKHGLIPLADAAIERVTKDAMAAAAAKAKAEAAKPKGKR